jgi:hypothetical protein
MPRVAAAFGLILAASWLLYAHRTQSEENTAGRQYEPLEIRGRALRVGGACDFEQVGFRLWAVCGSGVIREVETRMQHGRSSIVNRYVQYGQTHRRISVTTAQSLTLCKPP